MVLEPSSYAERGIVSPWRPFGAGALFEALLPFASMIQESSSKMRRIVRRQKCAFEDRSSGWLSSVPWNTLSELQTQAVTQGTHQRMTGYGKFTENEDVRPSQLWQTWDILYPKKEIG